MESNKKPELIGTESNGDALESDNLKELESILQESLQDLNEVGLKSVNIFAGYLLQNPWNRRDSTAEERQSYKESEDKRVFREKMLRAAAERKKESLKRAEEKLRIAGRYLANDTMKKLQNCTYWTLTVPYEGQYYAGFSELLEAWRRCKVPMPYIRDVALDFWEYGMMCGIRQERQRMQTKGERKDKLQGKSAAGSGSEACRVSEQGNTLMIDSDVKAILQGLERMEQDKRQKVAKLIAQVVTI